MSEDTDKQQQQQQQKKKTRIQASQKSIDVSAQNGID